MTRYLLRGPLGYVSRAATSDWTHHVEEAHVWTTSEAAHEACRRWHQIHGESLSVVVRDGTRLTPFNELIYRR